MSKIDWSAVWESVVANKTKIFIGFSVVLFLVLILWMVGFLGDWSFKRGVEADKEAIKEKAQEAANINAQIAVLEVERAKKIGEVEELAKDAARKTEVTVEAQANTNAAIDKWKEAANSNSNITGPELEKLLEKL